MKTFLSTLQLWCRFHTAILLRFVADRRRRIAGWRHCATASASATATVKACRRVDLRRFVFFVSCAAAAATCQCQLSASITYLLSGRWQASLTLTVVFYFYTLHHTAVDVWTVSEKKFSLCTVLRQSVDNDVYSNISCVLSTQCFSDWTRSCKQSEFHKSRLVAVHILGLLTTLNVVWWGTFILHRGGNHPETHLLCTDVRRDTFGFRPIVNKPQFCLFSDVTWSLCNQLHSEDVSRCLA